VRDEHELFVGRLRDVILERALATGRIGDVALIPEWRFRLPVALLGLTAAPTIARNTGRTESS
jgi:hypothetical protein